MTEKYTYTGTAGDGVCLVDNEEKINFFNNRKVQIWKRRWICSSGISYDGRQRRLTGWYELVSAVTA